MNRLVIVGGGIAGLAAAYYARKADSSLDLTLLESSNRWGGKITTERVPDVGGSFIIEGGPDTFLATKPYAVNLCRELGLGDRLHGTNQLHKNTYVLSHGRLLPLPDGLAMMVPTSFGAVVKSRLISWPGKARMGLDFILPAKPVEGDESLGAFVSRRLGREAYENLIEPLMSGIYAGDGDALSLSSTFPYLRELEQQYGSLGRGAIQMKRRSNGKSVQGSRSVFLTPTTGLAEMVERLVEGLQFGGVSLKLNTPVASVQDLAPGSWEIGLEDGERLPANGLILATPAYDAARLLASLDPALAAELERIPYASTATVSLAYRVDEVPRALDGYGYVIPRREGRRALACTWTSTKFPHRAPEGYALIRVFVGRAGEEIDRTESELLDLAREELRLSLGITAWPFLYRVHVWPRAMPQYNLGHPEILSRIEGALRRHARLALIGSGYRGIGIPDCIHSGELAARRILEDMSGSTSSLTSHVALDAPASTI